MTTTSLTSTTSGYAQRKRNKKSYLFSQNIYEIEVTGEDGEVLNYEIMADSAAEATATAEQLAYDSMVDISYINVIVMG